MANYLVTEFASEQEASLYIDRTMGQFRTEPAKECWWGCKDNGQSCRHEHPEQAVWLAYQGDWSQVTIHKEGHQRHFAIVELGPEPIAEAELPHVIEANNVSEARQIFTASFRQPEPPPTPKVRGGSFFFVTCHLSLVTCHCIIPISLHSGCHRNGAKRTSKDK
jgi:hypothetical protein